MWLTLAILSSSRRLGETVSLYMLIVCNVTVLVSCVAYDGWGREWLLRNTDGLDVSLPFYCLVVAPPVGSLTFVFLMCSIAEQILGRWLKSYEVTSGRLMITFGVFVLFIFPIVAIHPLTNI